MSKTYEALRHTYLIANGSTFDGRPVEIVHTTGRPDALRFWVSLSYADDLPDGAIVVGDGTSDGYDEQGNRIVSLPASVVRAYLDDEEAEAIWRMQEADAHLMACAVG